MNAKEHRDVCARQIPAICREDGSSRAYVAKSRDALERSLDTLRRADLTEYARYVRR